MTEQPRFRAPSRGRFKGSTRDNGLLKGRYDCADCSSTFPDRHLVRSHIKAHPIPYIYAVESLSTGYASNKGVHRHVRARSSGAGSSFNKSTGQRRKSAVNPPVGDNRGVPMSEHNGKSVSNMYSVAIDDSSRPQQASFPETHPGDIDAESADGDSHSIRHVLSTETLHGQIIPRYLPSHPLGAFREFSRSSRENSDAGTEPVYRPTPKTTDMSRSYIDPSVRSHTMSTSGVPECPSYSGRNDKPKLSCPPGYFSLQGTQTGRIPGDDLVAIVRQYCKDAHNKCLKSHQKASGNGTYHCTSGCGYSTKRTDDWRRHEELNQPQLFWVCSLCPPPIKKAFVTHRRDKLGDHVKKIHRYSDLDQVVMNSKVEFEAESEHYCGFCGLFSKSWSERNFHILGHFDSKSSESIDIMSHWKRPRPITESMCNNDHYEGDVNFSESYILNNDGFAEHPTTSIPSCETQALPFRERNNRAACALADIPLDSLGFSKTDTSSDSDSAWVLPLQQKALNLDLTSLHLVNLRKIVSDAFNSFVKQLDYAKKPHQVEHFFEIWRGLLKELELRFPNDPANVAFIRLLSHLDGILRPGYRQYNWTAKTLKVIENNADAAALLRYSLHRSPIDFCQIGVQHPMIVVEACSENSVDCLSISYLSEPESSQSDLAGLGSHLGCNDGIRHTAPSSSNRQSGSVGFTGSFGSQGRSSKSAGKRLMNEGREHPGPNRNGDESSGKRPKKENPYGDAKRLACPEHKHVSLHGEDSSEYSCDGIKANNMSEVALHVTRKHHTDLNLCHHCYKYFKDKWQYDQHRLHPLQCTKREQPRGPEKVGSQWEAFYLELHPDADNIPSPWIDDHTFKRAPRRYPTPSLFPTASVGQSYSSSHTMDSQPMPTSVEDDDYFATENYAPACPEMLHGDISELAGGSQTPHVEIGDVGFSVTTEQPQPSAHSLEMAIDSNNEFHTNDGVRSTLNSDEWRNDPKSNLEVMAALQATSDFCTKFVALSDTLLVEHRLDLTKRLRDRFHKYYQEYKSQYQSQSVASTLNTSISQQRVNREFTDEFTDLSNKLPPNSQIDLAKRLSGYLDGYPEGYRDGYPKGYLDGTYQALQSNGLVQAPAPLTLPISCNGDSGYSTGGPQGHPEKHDPTTPSDQNPDTNFRWGQDNGGSSSQQHADLQLP